MPQDLRADIPLEDIRAALERALASPEFTTATRLRRFLRFVVEESICGRAGQLKEYTIATAVFDRGDSFDPRTDSVVRVEARRLRAKLETYYESAGAGDTLRFKLPKGTYVPQFERAIPAMPPPAESPAESDTRGETRRPPWKLALLMGAAILLLAAGFWPRNHDPGRADASIAVLPFVNLSANVENEYFSDGLVDEITQTLSRINGLRVAARTSAFQFKGAGEDIREIARKLSVATVLEGSVREQGNQLRVTTQLISAADGFHIWSQTYDCSPTEAFEVQEQISRDIARALALKTNTHDNRPLANRHSANLEARSAYLRGRYHWNKRTAGENQTAVKYFEAAIAADPGYALAHAALADAFAVMAFNDQAPLAPSVASAREAATRALELDDGLAEAYAVLAFIKFCHDWDDTEAEALFRQAVSRSPNYSTARQWHGLYLTAMGRFEEALEEFRHAALLDPLSLIVSTDIAVGHYYRRDYSGAIEQLAATLAMDRDFFHARLLLGASHAALGNREKALEELRRAVDISGRDTDAVMRLAHAYAVYGEPKQAHALLTELIRTAERHGGSALQVASVYAGLGERDLALGWLAKALHNREANCRLLHIDPIFDGLRHDPSFEQLLLRIEPLNRESR